MSKATRSYNKISKATRSHSRKICYKTKLKMSKNKKAIQFGDVLRKRATKAVASFLSEGYHVVVATENVVFMRHHSNGNKISIYIRKNRFDIYKNGKFIKSDT